MLIKLGRGMAPLKGNTRPFSPRDLPDLALWLDASDTSSITQSGGAASQWNDKSGNGRHAIQGTAARQPVTGTRMQNGRNVLDFDGGSDCLTLHSGLHSISAGANTLLALVVCDSWEANSRIVSGKVSTASNYGLIGAPSSTQFQARNSTSGNRVNYTTTLDSSPHIVGLRRNGTLQEAIYDTLRNSNTSAADQTLTELTVGDDVANTLDQQFNGVIGEILIYSRALSNSQLNQLGQYLANKWGTTWTNI